MSITIFAVTMKVYFYHRSGYIYCRITINNNSKTITTGERCAKNEFIAKHQMSSIPEINYKLEYWKEQAKKCETFDDFIEVLQSGVNQFRLSEFIDYYIKSKPELTLGSIEKYKALKQIVLDYRDPKIDLISNKYAIDFFNHCRGWMKQNSAIQRLKQVKMMLNFAVDLDIINKNPIRFSPKKEIKPIVYLTQEELNTIYEKNLHPRLSVIRDIFVFCCYTGLEYSRVLELKPDQIKTDGKRSWIESVRKKTNKYANPRLLPIPLELINKYKGGAKCFPVRSNVKMNAYLKEIADICEIDKRLHTHLARHTFATTICLANGVSAEATAQMMGITLTMLLRKYGKIINQRVWDDTDELFDKFRKT